MPWKHIKDHTADFIDDIYLPEVVINSGDQDAPLEDPSDMKKEQIMQLLEHWRRPVPGSDLFAFSHFLVNSKSGEMAPALYTNSLGPRSLPQNALPSTANEPVTGAATWDAEYRNANPPPEDDSRFSPGPDINMSTDPAPEGREQASPEPDLANTRIEADLLPRVPARKPRAEKSKAKGKPKAPTKSAKKSALVGNGPLVPTGPRPKPKPKNLQATLVHHGSAAHQSVTGNSTSVDAAGENIRPEPQANLSQPATISNTPDTIPPATVDSHQGDQGGQVEGVLGRSRRQPKKRKLDACLTIQFEAAEKDKEREQAKLDKARAEKLAKRDVRVGRPAKRQRT